MIQLKKLAIAGAVSAAIFGATSAEAHVMYNKAIATDQVGGTDGWVWGGIGVPNGSAINPNNSAAANPGFSGTSDSNNDGYGDTPFGYVGSAHLNWAAALHHAGGSYTVSESHASSIGVTTEIDTGAGAWQDAGLTTDGALTANGPTGWKHQTDIGLIKADETMWVTLNPSVVSGTGFDIQNFGITVFTGMDTNTGSYVHHGAWNCPTCLSNGQPAPKPYDANNPFGTQGLSYLTHDATVDGVNGLTFKAIAGQVYSIYIGGAGVGNWKTNVADYSLTITTAPVPVPGAVWLFGSAMAGMVGFGRRRKAAVAA